MTSIRKPQPPKSDAANRTHDLIEARLGFWPLGCVIPPVLPTGAPARYCPLYAVCSRIPQDETVLCEVTEEEAEIDVTKPVPDSWLSEVHLPLRPAYDLDVLLSLDSSDYE